MRRLLQSFIFNRRKYDRPQDEWICGHACEGCPCALGPDAKGGCRATGECLPAKRGDRWYCTRSEAQGGPCSSGPFPEGACGRQLDVCVPQRSLRSQRGRWVLLTALASAGLVIVAITDKRRSEWISPGPLTAQHATSVERCADCHVENAALALSPASAAARQQQNNQLCLNCHDLGGQPASPHGRDMHSGAFANRKSNDSAPLLLPLARAVSTHGAQAELACATCHQEHHGRDHPLARLTDRQCQSCHQQQFESFSSGHPEFSQYPFTRRTRLQFDHASHLHKHFLAPEQSARAPTSCAGCHDVAVDGQQMLVRGFEQSCAQCHGSQIEGEGRAGEKGLEFFRLPGVDIAALIGAGESVGEWPKFAEGRRRWKRSRRRSRTSTCAS